MSNVLSFTEKKHKKEIDDMVSFSDQIDAVVHNALTQGLEKDSIAAVLANRTGNFLFASRASNELTDFCINVLLNKSTQEGKS